MAYGGRSPFQGRVAHVQRPGRNPGGLVGLAARRRPFGLGAEPAEPAPPPPLPMPAPAAPGLRVLGWALLVGLGLWLGSWFARRIAEEAR